MEMSSLKVKVLIKKLPLLHSSPKVSKMSLSLKRIVILLNKTWGTRLANSYSETQQSQLIIMLQIAPKLLQTITEDYLINIMRIMF